MISFTTDAAVLLSHPVVVFWLTRFTLSLAMNPDDCLESGLTFEATGFPTFASLLFAIAWRL